MGPKWGQTADPDVPTQTRINRHVAAAKGCMARVLFLQRPCGQQWEVASDRERCPAPINQPLTCTKHLGSQDRDRTGDLQADFWLTPMFFKWLYRAGAL